MNRRQFFTALGVLGLSPHISRVPAGKRISREQLESLLSAYPQGSLQEKRTIYNQGPYYLGSNRYDFANPDLTKKYAGTVFQRI